MATVRIESLTLEGKCKEALSAVSFELAKGRVERSETLTLAPYYVRLLVEVGAPQKAVLFSDSMEKKPLPFGSSAGVGPGGNPRIMMFSGDFERRVAERERAALLLATGEYERAAAAAAAMYKPATTVGLLAAYTKSIEAEARFRLGDLAKAAAMVKVADEALGKKSQSLPLYYVPRILYTACLVESRGASPVDAEAECQRGLTLAQKNPNSRRDVSLGYLALAEARLARNDTLGSREAASHGLELTLQLFGTNHQDAARAHQILAQTDLREGNAAAARSHAEAAIKIGLVVFGDPSPKLAELKRELAQCLDSSR